MLPSYYMSLARLQGKAWDLDAAEASARQALDLALSDSGEFAYDRTRALASIASIQLAGGRVGESLETARKASESLAGPVGGANDPALSAGVRRTLAATLATAGNLDEALAQALAAVETLRETSFDSHLAASLCVAADIFVDLGKAAEASAALEEARALQQRIEGGTDDLHVLRSTRAALDRGDAKQARRLLAAHAGNDGTARANAVSSFRRAVLEAEIELQDGDAGASARLATAAGERMRASDQARDLRPLISDGDRVEGLARLRSGDAATARPLLERALATRIELYLPASPKIAEVELALAECDLAQGRSGEAAQRVERAAAIEAQHASLSLRYTAPLERVRRRLAGR